MIGFAHRGARAEAPENTLEAFSRALRLGATGIESDAWVTSDGLAVLDHDGVVRRQLRRAPIATVARAELPAHIPALDDLFAACGRDFELSLDMKDAAALDAVLASVRTRGVPERLWACHHSVRTLAGWREQAGDIRLVLSTKRERVDPARARAAGIDAINLRLPEWTPDTVAEVHGEGLRAFGWDAQSERALMAAVALGLDGVYSDHVGRMMRVLTAAQPDFPD